MNKNFYKQLVLDVLIDIAENGPHDPLWGICINVNWHPALEAALPKHDGSVDYREREKAGNVLSRVMKRWPKRNRTRGESEFPVPGGRNAYYGEHTINTMWSENHEYGRARWELLGFCITELSKELYGE